MRINSNYSYYNPYATEPRSQKSSQAPSRPEEKSDQEGPGSEKCTANTDRVDQEIQQLKARKKELEQQIKSASQDERQRLLLEKELAQTEQELRQKDTEPYRRSHTLFS